MDRLARIAGEVTTAFEDRKRARWHLTTQWLRGDPRLRRYDELVQKRLGSFAKWSLSREQLLGRLNRRFKGKKWAATFEAAALEAQEMAREEMCKYLADNGVPSEDARTIAWSYSVGALFQTD